MVEFGGQGSKIYKIYFFKHILFHELYSRMGSEENIPHSSPFDWTHLQS
jgi:hypothetical protein